MSGIKRNARPTPTAPKRRRRKAKPPKSTALASGRFRILATLGALLVLVAMISAYLVTDTLVSHLEQAQTNQLVAAVDNTMQSMEDFEHEHLEILNLVRATNGVPQLVLSNNGRMMQRIIEPLVYNAGTHTAVVTDREGVEVLGLRRIVRDDGVVDYTVSEGTDLSLLPMVSAFIWQDVALTDRPVGLAQTPDGYGLFTAGPVMLDGEMVGIALVGSPLTEVAGLIRGNALIDTALYLPGGELVGATLGVNDLSELQIAPADSERARRGEVVAHAAWVNGRPYQVGYVPLVVRGQILGVVGVYLPDNIFTATEAGRQLLGLAFASAAAVVLIAAMVLITAIYTHRLARIRKTVWAIGQGDLQARTGIEAGDEVGALALSVDGMAERIHRRMELLALSLRAQRRETVRLNAVLESVPEGLVVQDNDGRVILMNSPARKMLGSRRVFRDSSLNVLTATVTNRLGAALAPGVYALGTPIRVIVNSRVIEAQAAAVMVDHAGRERRIGTVIMLRDVTVDARSELARAELIDDMARQVNQVTSVHADSYAAPFNWLIQGIQNNMISLDRMIAELRDLNTLDRHMLRVGPQALTVETLVRELVHDWQDAIKQAGLALHLAVIDRDLYVLGDERRLRWAMGNILDNAIKYTQRGGEISVAVSAGSDSDVAIVFSDNGVGIARDDMPFIFQRFFRGTPRKPNGQVVHRHGSGQGLYVAKRVIEAHGGSVKLNSWPGAGTDMRVALPAVVPEPVENWPGTDETAAIDTGRYTVAELESEPLEPIKLEKPFD